MFPTKNHSRILSVTIAVLLTILSVLAHGQSVEPTETAKHDSPATEKKSETDDTGWWDGIKGSVNKYSADTFGSTPEDELKKVSQFLYKVVEITNTNDAKTIETRLNSLGREGWDCFETLQMSKLQNEVNPSAKPTALPKDKELPQAKSNPNNKTLHILCKKRPLSYLRVLGRGW